MTSVFRTLFWGAWPLGNLAGGLLAAAVGAATALWTTALAGAIVNLTIVFTPLWRVRDFAPQPSAEPPLPQADPAPAL